MKLSYPKILSRCIALFLVVAFVSACGATPKPINKEELSSLQFPCKMHYHNFKEQKVLSTKINNLEILFIEEKDLKQIKINIENNSYINDSLETLETIINFFNKI